MSKYTPQSFIKSLDLSKLDENTAQDIREFINSEDFKYIELSENLDEFHKVVALIETHFPEALGLPSHEEAKANALKEEEAKKSNRESIKNQTQSADKEAVLSETKKRVEEKALAEAAAQEEQEARDAEELSKRLSALKLVDSKTSTEKEKKTKISAKEKEIQDLKEKVDVLSDRLELVQDMFSDDPKNKNLKGRIDLILEMRDEYKQELADMGHKYALGGYIAAAAIGFIGGISYKNLAGGEPTVSKTHAKLLAPAPPTPVDISKLPKKIGFYDNAQGRVYFTSGKGKKLVEITKAEYDEFRKMDAATGSDAALYKRKTKKEGKYFVWHLTPIEKFESGGTLADFYEQDKDFYIDKKTYEVVTRESIVAYSAKDMEDAKKWIEDQYKEYETGGDIDANIITWKKGNDLVGKSYYYAFANGHFLATEESNIKMVDGVLTYSDVDLVFLIDKDHFISDKAKKEFESEMKVLFPELNHLQVTNAVYKNGGTLDDINVKNEDYEYVIDKIKETQQHRSNGEIWFYADTAMSNKFDHSFKTHSNQHFTIKIIPFGAVKKVIANMSRTAPDHKVILEVDHIPVFEQEVWSETGAIVFARKLISEIAIKIHQCVPYEFVKFEDGGTLDEKSDIIGYTKSSKAVYANPNHPSHKDFTEVDHDEARHLHFSEETTKRTMTERDEAATTHGRAADKIAGYYKK